MTRFFEGDTGEGDEAVRRGIGRVLGEHGEDWPPSDLTKREIAETERALCRWRDEIHEIQGACVTWDHYAWGAEVCELIADFRRGLK